MGHPLRFGYEVKAAAGDEEGPTAYGEIPPSPPISISIRIRSQHAPDDGRRPEGR